MKGRVYSRDKRMMSQNGTDFKFVETIKCDYMSTCRLCGANRRGLCGRTNECNHRDDGLIGYWEELP